MSRASSSHSLRSSGSFRGERQTSTSSFESEEWKSTCMVSQYTQSSAQPGTIDFRLGQPAPSSLPVELVQTAALSTFGARKDDLCDPLMLQYGVVGGHFDFRAALAQFLMENTHNLEVRAEDLMATAGVSHGIHLCARLLAKPGDVVLMEEPSYPLAAEIFKAAGLRVAGVPQDDEGLVIDAALEQTIQALKPTLFYTIPIHNNPTGATLSPDRREALVALAAKHNFRIIADEVYQILGFSHEALEVTPLRRYDVDGNGDCVVSLGSFSKILAPGLRLGWVHASHRNLKKLKEDPVLLSGGGINPISCMIAQSCMAGGALTRRLRDVQMDLADKCEVLCTALEEQLPASIWTEPDGGYFVWVRLAGVDTEALCRQAPGFSVAFLPGPRTAAAPTDDGKYRDALRLSFAFYSAAELREGVWRLAELVRFADSGERGLKKVSSGSFSWRSDSARRLNLSPRAQATPPGAGRFSSDPNLRTAHSPNPRPAASPNMQRPGLGSPQFLSHDRGGFRSPLSHKVMPG